MHALTKTDQPLSAPRREPLAQVEVLLLFHPNFQSLGPRRAGAEACAAATQGWLTLDVYGRRSVSGFTGRPIMENLRLEARGQDLEPVLPEEIVNEVADYVLEEA